MHWNPPLVGLRVFPLGAFLFALSLSSACESELRLPEYTELPLPAPMRAAIDRDAPSPALEIQRERAAVVRSLLRGESPDRLAWALQLDFALGRPQDALRLVERLGSGSEESEDVLYLTALARYERARAAGDPWQSELDLERCRALCRRSWTRQDVGEAAASLGAWAELSLGSPERVREQIDPQLQPQLWRQLREVEMLESSHWIGGLAAADGDPAQLRRLFELRPSLYCYFALNQSTMDALLAVESRDLSLADSLATLLRGRMAAIDDLPELIAPYEGLLARWVDARPEEVSSLSHLRRARKLLGGAGNDDRRSELLRALRDAELEVFEALLHWKRHHEIYLSDPVQGLRIAEEMLEAAERGGDPYLIDKALGFLKTNYSNLPDVRQAARIEGLMGERTGHYGFEQRSRYRSLSRSALRLADYAAAHSAASRQLERALRLGDRTGRITAHVDRSYVELMLGQVSTALAHADEALRIAEDAYPAGGMGSDLRLELDLAEIVRALALLETGRDAEGFEAFEALRAGEVVGDGRQPILAYLLESMQRRRHGDYDLASECLDNASALNAERGYRDYRWRIPHERARLARTRGEMEEALRLYEEAWRIRREYGLELRGEDLGSRFLGGSRELADGFLELLYEAGAAAERTLEVDQVERALRWGISPALPPSPAADEALLQFRVGERSTQMWCLRSGGVSARSLPIGRARWSQLRRELEPRLVAQETLPEEYARLFGEELLEGMDDLLGMRTIRVAPASEMAMFPWSLLAIGGRRLCETQDVVITPLHRPRPRRRVDSNSSISIFAYSGDGDGLLLPGVERHARELAESRPELELVCGPEATLPRLLEQLERSRSIVLAGHAGVEADGTPFFQFASAAPEAARLRPSDLYGLDLSALELAVLVGCATLRDRSGAQSAPGFGIAGAFLAAGAEQVLASVVPIRDEWNWSGFVRDALDSPSKQAAKEGSCSADSRFVLLRN